MNIYPTSFSTLGFKFLRKEEEKDISQILEDTYLVKYSENKEFPCIAKFCTLSELL